jgi:nucleotide-binding universal stress UspA family protein
MRVLVCTESKPDASRSAVFASQLGLISNSELTLLGVAHTQEDVAATEAAMQRVGSQLNSAASIEPVLQIGDPAHEIISASEKKDYDLVVLSSLAISPAICSWCATLPNTSARSWSAPAEKPLPYIPSPWRDG